MTSGTPGGTPAAGPAQSAGCPDDERLAALLGADARPRAASASASGAGAGADELALHLEGCEACRRRLDAMAGGSEWVAAARADDANVAAGDEVAGELGAGAGGDSTEGRVPPLLQAVMDE